LRLGRDATSRRIRPLYAQFVRTNERGADGAYRKTKMGCKYPAAPGIPTEIFRTYKRPFILSCCLRIVRGQILGIAMIQAEFRDMLGIVELQIAIPFRLQRLFCARNYRPGAAAAPRPLPAGGGGSVPPSARIFMFLSPPMKRVLLEAMSASRAASSASMELSNTSV
jgi:hypothetical protein